MAADPGEVWLQHDHSASARWAERPSRHAASNRRGERVRGAESIAHQMRSTRAVTPKQAVVRARTPPRQRCQHQERNQRQSQRANDRRRNVEFRQPSESSRERAQTIFKFRAEAGDEPAAKLRFDLAAITIGRALAISAKAPARDSRCNERKVSRHPRDRLSAFPGGTKFEA